MAGWRDYGGRRGQGPTAKVPGEPGTRRHRYKKWVAEEYAHKSPVAEWRQSGEFQAVTGEMVEMEFPVAVFGDPIEQRDPGELVMDELARSAGHVRDLEALIRRMELAELITDDVVRTEEEKVGGGEAGDYTVTKRETRKQINKLWQLYEAERKHLALVANAAVKAGIELRRVRLAEAQLDRVQAAILLALGDLGVDTADARVRQAIGGRIAELQAGGGLSGAPVAVPAERLPARTPVPPPPAADF